MASDDVDQDSMADDWAAAMAEQADVDAAMAMAGNPISFEELQPEPARPAGSPE